MSGIENEVQDNTDLGIPIFDPLEHYPDDDVTQEPIDFVVGKPDSDDKE